MANFGNFRNYNNYNTLSISANRSHASGVHDTPRHFFQVPHAVPISAHHKWNFDDLLAKMWQYLALTRIYTKPKGQLPDYEAPVVLKSDRRTVEDFCNALHKR